MAKVKLSKLQLAYREFFKAMMEEYGVTSPVQLGDKRSEFFTRIKKEWPAAKRKIKEGYVRQVIRNLIVEEFGVPKRDGSGMGMQLNKYRGCNDEESNKAMKRQTNISVDDLQIDESNTIIREDDTYYYIEYYDKQGGHGDLDSYSDFNSAYKHAINFYKREKKDGELGKSTGYIGVGGGKDKFAIIYIDKDYFNMIKPAFFDDKDSYNKWMKVAKKVLSTKKPSIGNW